MKLISCTTSLLAMAVTGYSGGALSQQTCQNDVQQLRSENEQRQVPQGEREEVAQLLDRAARGDAAGCRQFVTQARRQMEQAEARTGAEATRDEAQPPLAGERQAAPAETEQQARRRETDPRRSQAQASGLAQSARESKMQVQIEQMPATVEVDAGAPRVVVKQQPPKVTVEQQPPLVEITQPEAQVNVTQAEPKVTVNQANPRVDVQQAQPQVQVVQAGEPQVRMVGPGTEAGSPGAAQGDGQEQLTSAGAISSQEAAQLEGKNLLSSQGEEVGQISDVVRSQTDRELHAVVDVGGFFGIGERSVAIPVQRGQIDDEGNLQVPLSREQLEQLSEYDAREYDTEL